MSVLLASIEHAVGPSMAWPAGYPRGARFTISGLQSATRLNGTEVSILSWNAEKERFAVKVVAKVKHGEPTGHLVRPSNLVRSASWCAQLSEDELSGCLSKLPSWQDAARASAVCTAGGAASGMAPGRRQATPRVPRTGERCFWTGRHDSALSGRRRGPLRARPSGHVLWRAAGLALA